MAIKLRTDLEIQAINYKGNRALLISDRLGLIKNPVVLQGEAVDILALINGEKRAEDIQLEFLRQRGYSLEGASLVSQVLEKFSKLMILDTPEFRQEKERLAQEFSKMTGRPAALSGQAYPAEEDNLRLFIKEILESSSQGEAEKEKNKNREKTRPELPAAGLQALIAPHIDLQAGRRVYGAAYRWLQGLSFDRVIVLGIGHSLENGLLALTEKDFITPFGRVKTDKEAVKKLKEAAGTLAAPDDLAHRTEHSIEFQLLFLQYCLGKNLEVIPILCGSFHQWLKEVTRASEIPGLNLFIRTLKELTAEPQKRTLIVAGVDLSHVGPKFGHRQKASELKEVIINFDQQIIEALLHLDAVSFWKRHQEVEDWFNVCGFPALAILLEIIEAKRAYFLDYDLVEEPASGSAVSLAALAFFNMVREAKGLKTLS